MKCDREYEAVLRETGEYSDLEEFDKQNEQHIFSPRYEKQKEALLIKEKIKNEKVVPMKNSSRMSKKKIAIIALIATLTMGTVVVAADAIKQLKFARNPETGVLVDPDTLTEEEYFNHDVFIIQGDAQYEDGTPVTKENILGPKHKIELAE